jgi:DNA-binding response OmpR family regulator
MARPHLLLVDADPRTLRMLEVNLKNDGFSVTVASDGAAALEQAKIGLPDLVVTETRLPRLDGFELVRRIRELPGGDNLPIVFIAPEASAPGSGLSASQNDQVRAVQLSVLDCLVKPVSVRELVTRVNLLLARRTQQLFAAPGGSQLHFTGHLEDVAVIDMLRAFEQGRRSGVLNIEHGVRQATILFKHGKVLDAEQGQLRGEEAVYRTFLWSNGVYELEFCEIDVPDPIAIGSAALLMEGMRRIDEWGRLAEQLPSSTVVFTVDAKLLLQRLAEIPDELNPVLRLFDGERSLMAVIDESPFDDLSTLSVISKMYFEGVLRTVESPTRALQGTLRALGSGAAAGSTGDSVVRQAAELPEANVRPHAPGMSADPLPHTILYCEPPQNVRLSQRSTIGRAATTVPEPTPTEIMNALRTDTGWPVVALPVDGTSSKATPVAAQTTDSKSEVARTKDVAEAEFEEVGDSTSGRRAGAPHAAAAQTTKSDSSSTATQPGLDEGSFFARGEQGAYSAGSDRAPTSRPSDEITDVELDPRVLSALTVRRGQGLRWAAFIVGAALLLCAYVLFGVFRTTTTRAESPSAVLVDPTPPPPPPPPLATTEPESTSEVTVASSDESSTDETSSSGSDATSVVQPGGTSHATGGHPAGLGAGKPPIPAVSKPSTSTGTKRPPTARFPSAPENR